MIIESCAIFINPDYNIIPNTQLKPPKICVFLRFGKRSACYAMYVCMRACVYTLSPFILYTCFCHLPPPNSRSLSQSVRSVTFMYAHSFSAYIGVCLCVRDGLLFTRKIQQEKEWSLALWVWQRRTAPNLCIIVWRLACVCMWII